jgi:hypothetical protein
MAVKWWWSAESDTTYKQYIEKISGPPRTEISAAGRQMDAQTEQTDR